MSGRRGGDSEFDLNSSPAAAAGPPPRQTLFFSATWPREVQAVARALCRNDPVRVFVGGAQRKLVANKDITQHVQVCVLCVFCDVCCVCVVFWNHHVQVRKDNKLPALQHSPLPGGTAPFTHTHVASSHHTYTQSHTHILYTDPAARGRQAARAADLPGSAALG